MLSAIGEAHGRSVAQVVLRWLVQREVVVIPKSVRPERMAEDIDVFDVSLTDEQMAQVASLDTGVSVAFDHRDPVNGRPAQQLRLLSLGSAGVLGRCSSMRDVLGENQSSPQ